jgi:hypothetical protein
MYFATLVDVPRRGPGLGCLILGHHFLLSHGIPPRRSDLDVANAWHCRRAAVKKAWKAAPRQGARRSAAKTRLPATLGMQMRQQPLADVSIRAAPGRLFSTGRVSRQARTTQGRGGAVDERTIN